MIMPSMSNSAIVKEDADLDLSEMTENSLMISKTHEITKFRTNNILTNANNRGLYSNGLSTMISTASRMVGESSQDSENINKVSSFGPLGSSSSPVDLTRTDGGFVDLTDAGLFATSFPDSWSDWESKRRVESIGHGKKLYRKNQNKLRSLKRTKCKTVETKKASSTANFRRRRLRLERSVGKHLKNRCQTYPVQEETDMVPFQSSKSLRRRQRRRIVRFVDDEITEWKREKAQAGFGRGKNGGTLHTPFLEADRERKKDQRALLDLQVGMKCMGL